ncbi:MAG: tetratricopeptide repeat protein [Lentisphaerae bacterium]|nr:tetratricopeptide repeat protein [Lentisphaerota bacterium]
MQTRITAALLIGLALLNGVMAPTAEAARERKTRDRGDESEYAAYRLLKRAEDLVEAGERDRGVKMLETIIQQYPKSKTRFKAYLALGRNSFEQREFKEAIDHMRNLGKLKNPEKPIEGEDREMYLEGLYITGVSHFQLRQHSAAFSVLRKITDKYPNTVWANQAYYYIGMAHFAQEHWNKAIKSLSLVGTFVDPDSVALEFVEAGHRFHVKISDADLPILHRLGREIKVELTTKSGDKETVVCSPLAGNSDIFLGSVSSDLGDLKAGDKILQVSGGDTITVRYYDDNTKDGSKDVLKEKTVKLASTGSMMFTLGTYETKATSAFLGQPVFIKMRDADLDVTAGRDAATVKLQAVYKVEEEDEEDVTKASIIDIDKLMAETEEQKYRVRDELTLTLNEQGEQIAHSGLFLGSTRIARATETEPAKPGDEVLSCAIGDEVVATYVDNFYIGGEGEREVTVRLGVLGEVDSTPMVAKSLVSDAAVRARKEAVEAEAYLELARIFKSMGLREGAEKKAVQGLDHLEFTLSPETPVGRSQKEHAYQLKWELYLAMDDLDSAMATCKLFNKLYPESPLVDTALMGIGKVLTEREEFERAMAVFRQILALPHSLAKAEAQFRIAEVLEGQIEEDETGQAEAVGKERAVQAYRTCARKYPESEFAGVALGKVVDYHLETKDYVVADDLLEQVFLDYQDEDFLDSMLLKWVLVSYRMGNFEKAYDRCSQLIFEYPGSPYAAKAKAILPKIEQRIKRSSTSEKNNA